MRWNEREIRDPLIRLRRLLAHGHRWSSVYWRQVFDYEGRSVNAAAIPIYLIQAIEQGRSTTRQVARLMAERSAGADIEHRAAYAALWDEAVTYVLGVRQDVLRARAAAEFSLQLATRGAWLDAFRAATIAFDTEQEHAGDARYWHPFLYSLSDVLIRLGHGRSYTALRRLAQASPRNPSP